MTGITDLRDESDRNGMRIIIELRRDVNPKVLLNNLYKQTNLQTSFGVNMLALVDGKPLVLNLKQVLHHYLEHQVEVIRRRTQFDLRKAEETCPHPGRSPGRTGSHRRSDRTDPGLPHDSGSPGRFGGEDSDLSEKQTQAILDMRLQRLTGLEREKIESRVR